MKKTIKQEELVFSNLDSHFNNKIDNPFSNNAIYYAYTLAGKDITEISSKFLVLGTFTDYPNNFKIHSNIKIPVNELNVFQIYDLHLKAYYSNKKPNKIRIDENCIKSIENNTDKVNVYATKNRQNISITSNLFDEFRFGLSADDEGMKLINSRDLDLKRACLY